MKIIEIKVIPNSKCEEVIVGDTVIVRVKEKPEKGQANKAVLKLLRRHFGAEITIISGLKAHKKRVKIG